MDKSSVTGGFAVPDGAPQETSQPLSPDLIAEQLARARANEKPQTPFNPKPRGIVAKAVKQVEEFFGSMDVAQTPPEAPVAAPPTVDYSPAPEQPPLPPPEPWQKAASDTDTPSRGIPQPQPLGKEITGGFGVVGEALYFPLDGFELGQILMQKCDELKARIANDIRFSMAHCYPRVRAFVEIYVEGFADQNLDFAVKTVPLEQHKTPIEVAREHADEICFVLLAPHVEMTAEGESVTPPNAARIEAGLDVPMKRRIDSPGGGVIVDVTR